MNYASPFLRPFLLLGAFLLIFLSLSSCTPRGLELPIPPALAGQAFSLSADTISLDTLPTGYVSSTYRLTIYNPSSKAIEGLSLSQQGGDSRGFQINVDGRAGTSFPNLRLAPRDSMLVLIRAYLQPTTGNEPELVQDSLRIQQGQAPAHYLPLRVYRQNVEHIQSLRISTDRTIASARPLLIHGEISVDEGATLTLLPPTRLLFASGAGLRVGGRLMVRGEAGRFVRFESVRGDRLLPHIPYRRVPGQWQGLSFAPTSSGNELRYTYIGGAVTGLLFEGASDTETQLATISHSLITHSSEYGLRAGRGRLSLIDSEVSNAGQSCLSLAGGQYEIRRSSLVNFYAWGRKAVPLALDYTDVSAGANSSSLLLQQCVLDGARSVSQLRQAEETGGVVSLNSSTASPRIEVRQCYLRSVNYAQRFPSILWEGAVQARPLSELARIYTRLGEDSSGRQDFGYNFRPLPDAPFVSLGKSTEALPPDLSGRSRNPNAFSLGAYEP